MLGLVGGTTESTWAECGSAPRAEGRSIELETTIAVGDVEDARELAVLRALDSARHVAKSHASEGCGRTLLHRDDLATREQDSRGEKPRGARHARTLLDRFGERFSQMLASATERHPEAGA